MSKYHINEKTGVPQYCGNEICSLNHYMSYQDCVAVFTTKIVNKILDSPVNEDVLTCLQEIVDYGFVKPTNIDDNPAHRLLVEFYFESKNQNFDYVDQEEIRNISANLWLFRDSPLKNEAKNMILLDNYPPSGYEKSDVLNISTMKNNLSFDDEDNIIAFDIEVDTTYGKGLIPFSSQITEIVITTKENTRIISGDEKFILEKFAEFMNFQHESRLLCGWNNRGFDNIFLQTRADFHNISNWNGELTKVEENHSRFISVSIDGEIYGFNWKTLDGNIIADFDIFQAKLAKEKITTTVWPNGLKDFVQGFGFDPVRVERKNLHNLTTEERKEYAASDGLATYFAYHMYKEHIDWQEF